MAVKEIPLLGTGKVDYVRVKELVDRMVFNPIIPKGR